MTKYIAFLRGINVGNIRIKMTDLKSAFYKMGFHDVETFLQTGNVVFNSNKPNHDIKSVLGKGLTETFHYEAYILVYEFGILTEVIAQYPMQRDENHHAYVVFIDNDTIFEELKTAAQGLADESNYIAPGDKLLYWKVPIGQSTDTVFAKIVAKAKYKSSVTIRNMNTLEKMI